MKIFNDLQPELIWKYFEEILQIPRPSKKEEKIIAYLLDFAEKNNIEAKTDEIGNVLMLKPATQGKENLRTAILQSHIDMVCEKNSDVEHNFETDPIDAYIDGNNVKARGTTLGADDGIGVAAALAVLASNNLEHGPLECLFTVDEETGLTGAFEIKPGFINGDILINLDSEDEGELFIGCAGGKDTIIQMEFETKKTTQNSAFSIKVSGLKGGHSGDDINKGLGNSIKIISNIINNAINNYNVSLCCVEGGNLCNAIPREAQAIVTVSAKKSAKFITHIEPLVEKIKSNYSYTEPKLDIKIEPVELPQNVLTKSSQDQLIKSLLACPHGVQVMSRKMPGMVETSTNLASVNFKSENIIEIVTSQRSDSDYFLDELSDSIRSLFELTNSKVEHTDSYPGWEPNPNSEIADITAKSYEKLFGKKPVVRSIHAGLECGLFLEKYPKLDMISFGPSIRQVHSPDERLEIDTVEKFWKLLVDVLGNIPEK